MAEEAAWLAVARLQKPHGLKGEAVVWSLTDEPERVFEAGRLLTPLNHDGTVAGAPLTLERARQYHRQWLLKFRDIPDRTALERLPRGLVLGVARQELTPPRNDQLYRHEVPGTAVIAGGKAIGVARELVAAPGGDLLVVEVDGRDCLVPFRKPILVRVDRAARTIELDPPEGLFEV